MCILNSLAIFNQFLFRIAFFVSVSVFIITGCRSEGNNYSSSFDLIQGEIRQRIHNDGWSLVGVHGDVTNLIDRPAYDVVHGGNFQTLDNRPFDLLLQDSVLLGSGDLRIRYPGIPKVHYIVTTWIDREEAPVLYVVYSNIGRIKGEGEKTDGAEGLAEPGMGHTEP